MVQPEMFSSGLQFATKIQKICTLISKQDLPNFFLSTTAQFLWTNAVHSVSQCSYNHLMEFT